MKENLKVLIVEDELLIAETISIFLEERGHQSIGFAISYEEALDQINAELPDIVLIDVRLYGLKSGVDLASYLISNHPSIPFVFLTSQFDKRIVESIMGTRPAGYLAKPLQKESLWTTLEITYNNYLLNQTSKKKIQVFDGQKSIFIEEDHIILVEADHVYIKIITNDGNTILSRGTLTQILDELSPSKFQKCHRSYIVNIEKVESYTSTELRISDHVIPISRSRKNDILSLFNPA